MGFCCAAMVALEAGATSGLLLELSVVPEHNCLPQCHRLGNHDVPALARVLVLPSAR